MAIMLFLMSHYCNLMFCLFPFFLLLRDQWLITCTECLCFSLCSGQFGSFAISRHPTTIINRHTGITLSLPFSFSLFPCSLSHTHSQSLHFAAKWCIMGAGRGLKRQWSKLVTRNSGGTLHKTTMNITCIYCFCLESLHDQDKLASPMLKG